MRTLLLAFLILSITCCTNQKEMKIELDVQGHRGCRGLMPENTIQGFIKALNLGVNTLELDVTANRNGDVIISHEPFFNHEISTKSDGSLVTEEEEKSLNLYNMTMEEIKAFDVGLRNHPRFPIQKKIATQKPTLRELVEAANAHIAKHNLPTTNYNIEIKRGKDFDEIYHPDFQTFANLVINEIKSLGISENTTVQCFDLETLQYIHATYPTIKTVFLVANKKSFEENLEELGFLPFVYSPEFSLVDTKLVKYCKENSIKLIPWTVNKSEDIERLINLGVDGIISDYPDKVIEILASVQNPK